MKVAMGYILTAGPTPLRTDWGRWWAMGPIVDILAPPVPTPCRMIGGDGGRWKRLVVSWSPGTRPCPVVGVNGGLGGGRRLVISWHTLSPLLRADWGRLAVMGAIGDILALPASPTPVG